MTECWLKPNRRALTLGMMLPFTMGAVGCLLLLNGPGTPLALAACALGGGLTLLGLIVMIGLLRHLIGPRIGYRNGMVLFFLRAAGPVEIPVDVVEGFLLGQSPGWSVGRGRPFKTATVTVRLAESASEWRERDVNSALATWGNGSISILGTWCEPLSVERVASLNRNLTRAKRSAGDLAVGPSATEADG